MEPRTYKAKRKGAVFIAGHHQSVEQRSFFFFFNDFYLSFEREHKWGAAGTEGEGEAGCPLSRESDGGLDTRTPGS